MFIGSNHTVILLLKMDDPPIIPHLTSHKTFKIQAPRLDLIGPKGHDDFSDPLHPDRHVPIDLSHAETPRGCRGFRSRQGAQKAGFGRRENVEEIWDYSFWSFQERLLEKIACRTKCFPQKTKKMFSKQTIFLWCVSFMIVRFHMISLQWLSTK